MLINLIIFISCICTWLYPVKPSFHFSDRNNYKVYLHYYVSLHLWFEQSLILERGLVDELRDLKLNQANKSSVKCTSLICFHILSAYSVPDIHCKKLYIHELYVTNHTELQLKKKKLKFSLHFGTGLKCGSSGALPTGQVSKLRTVVCRVWKPSCHRQPAGFLLALHQMKTWFKLTLYCHVSFCIRLYTCTLYM